MTVAALYVEPDGAYIGLPGVDPWDERRDARTYAGPHPVVAHPPCQRWGRFWHGSTRKPHQFKLHNLGRVRLEVVEVLLQLDRIAQVHGCVMKCSAALTP